MGWFTKIFICGRGINTSAKIKRDTISGITEGGLVSEITQVGETQDGQFDSYDRGEVLTKTQDNCIRILAHKNEGEKLGIRLVPKTVDIHSFERGSPLWKFSNEIPVGSSICKINGVAPTTETIRN